MKSLHKNLGLILMIIGAAYISRCLLHRKCSNERQRCIRWKCRPYRDRPNRI